MNTYIFYFLFFFLILLNSADGKKKKKNNMQNTKNDIALKYYLYRRTNRNGIRLFREKLPDNFDNSLPTFVILHGMGNNHNSICQRGIRNALLDKVSSNIIVPSYTNSSVLYAVLYQDVARKVGIFLIKEKIDPSETQIIGISLGAQIAGVLARRSGFTPRDIYALDAAGPLFDQLSDNQRLSPSSANYVQVFHTNAGMFGAVSPLGNDDIYVNGGDEYPCCSTSLCRHSGACDLFVRTVESGLLSARVCDNLQQARTSSCRGSNIDVGFGSPRQSGRRISHLSLHQCGPRN